jgi:CRISPR type III-B/RAMP module-associated protein Cmr3
MKSFLLRPLDWVSFGPPRPSSAGETHHRATDLPSPTTFQGIVRTALLAGSGNDLSDRSRAAQDARKRLVGGPDSLLPGWQLRGPFFTEVVDDDRSGWMARPWVRTPRFLVGTHGEPLLVALVGSPEVETGSAALNDLSDGNAAVLCARPAESAIEPLGGWLSPRGLSWALQGAVGSFAPSDHHGGSLPPFVRRQKIAGVAIDAETGTAEDGMLFSNEVLRFKDRSGLAGWLEVPSSTDIAEDALTRGALASCGWKSRPAVLEELPDLDPDFQHVLEGRHLPNEVDEEQAFFLTALTPVYCERDVYAHGAIEHAMTTHASWPADVQVCVLASMTGPARVIGGLEAVSKKPRPNRSCWDAGSAWLFVLRGGDSRTRASALRVLNNAHTLGRRNDTSFGYGHTLTGVGPKVNEEILQMMWRRKEARA